MVALGYPLPQRYQVTGRFNDARPTNLLTGGLHTGIDLGAPGGTPVLAAAAGTVRVWWNPAGGRMVGIVHGPGLETRYAHLMRALVRTGDQVAAGQQIGLVGSTGKVTGTHLHYEVLIKGQTVDPAPYLGGADARTVADRNAMPVPEGEPGAFPLDPGKTCPVGYVAGTVNPQSHGWLPFGPWFNRPTNPDGTINACVREDLAPGDNAATSDLIRVALPFTLEATLNIAVVAGGALLVWRGVMTMLKP